MRIRSIAIACACALAGSLSVPSRAMAQLVFGTTTTSTSNPSALYLDVATNQLTTLWNSAAQKKVNGAAADNINRRLYTNDAARLNFWDFGNLGTTPTLIAGMYRTNDNVTFTATGVDSLAWANGKLYGGTSFGSTVYKRGIYEIATTPDGASHCVMTPLWLDPSGIGTSSGTLVLDGLDFNFDDNKFYATQTADATDASGNPVPRGLYSIDAFGSGAMTKITDFPDARTDIDGLAIGGGKFWMTAQDAVSNSILIYPYDLATNSYGATITVPLTDATNRASGATWAPDAIPEPACIGLVGLPAAAALTRRRRVSRACACIAG